MNVKGRKIRYRVARKFFSIALIASLGFTTVFAGNTDFIVQAETRNETSQCLEKVTEQAEQIGKDYSGNELADSIEDGVMLHAWNWSFEQIKNEIPAIAEAGFSAVQTSPIQPNKDGSNVANTGDWWKFYQPVDFAVGNKLGSEEQFKEMCEEAHKYGVKIVVDVVVQHLANVSGDGGNAKSNRSPQIPSYIRDNDAFWHNDNFPGSSDADRYQMTHGPVGMPDLNTSNEQLQDIIINFFTNAQKDGADGFRFDTAKHIETPTDNGFASQFWPRVKNATQANDPDVFLYGEILNTAGPGGYSDIQKYTPYIRVTNSEYGHNVRAAAIDRNADKAKFTNNNIFGSNANEWVLWNESHDTYAGSYESDPSRNHSEEEMLMAWCAVAARTSPALYFSRPTATTGNAFNSTSLGAHTDKYKDKRIAEVNKFHNAFADQTEYVTTSDNVLVVERGTAGVALINFNGGSKSVSIKMNKMADGTYVDQISGAEFKVSGGTLTGQISDGGVAAIYNKGPVTKNPTVSVSKESGTFSEPFDLTLTPSNATKATYCVNGENEKEFTAKTTVKIGEGCSAGDKVTVKVTATGDGEPFEKTFTYTMTETPEYKLYVRAKKSDFSTAPNAYVYLDGKTAKELNGKWPGSAMKEDGDYYVFCTDEADSAKIIFSYGGGQDPAAQQPGYDVTGYMEYDKNAKKVTAFIPESKAPVKTTPPAKTTSPAKTTPPADTEPPVKTTPPVETEAPTKPPSPTKTPSPTKPPETEPPKEEITETEAPKTEEPIYSFAPEFTEDPDDIPGETPIFPTQEPEYTMEPKPTEDAGSQGENCNQKVDKKNTNIIIKVTNRNSSIVQSAAGKKIILYMCAVGGQGKLSYTVEVVNSAKKKVYLDVKKSTSSSYEKQVSWLPTRAGTYTVRVTVTDEKGYYNTKSVSYKITTPVKVKTFKVSKSTDKKKWKFVFTAKASSISSVKYRFKLQKVGSKTVKILRGYSTKKIYTWKPTAKGKYYVYLQVKDKDGNTKEVKKKIVVK